MRLREYEERDGRKVWLSNDEIDLLLEQPDELPQEIALALGARCGLRAAEIVSVSPENVVEGPTGKRIRVEHGKGGKFREVPVPPMLYQQLRAVAQTRSAGAQEPYAGVTTRTVERWVDSAARSCQSRTDDTGWKHLGPHDLRRSWATLLVGAGVDAGMIMEWGGWENWQTFRKHYLGAFSPEMEKEEVEKVGWL